MIPILYSRDRTPKDILSSSDFGLGVLSDCISATVTEELNGRYELEIEYPVAGAHFNEVDYSSWIKAIPSANYDEVQLFRVYKISKEINGTCMIYAEHVSYLLSYAIVEPANGTAAFEGRIVAALSEMQNHIIAPGFKPVGGLPGEFEFEIECDWLSPVNYFVMGTAKSVREYLLSTDDEYSFQNIYGNIECKFSNFHVTVYEPGVRGADNGVVINYGRNLTNLKMDVSDEEIITNYYPYVSLEYPPDGYNPFPTYVFRDLSNYTGRTRFIVSDPAYENFPWFARTIALNLLDFDKWKGISTWEEVVNLQPSDFEECVADYWRAHDVDNNGPTTHAKRSIDVSFIDASTAEEYRNIFPLEKINLGDTVTVKYNNFSIDSRFRVVKTEYNVLEERYNQLTLGSDFNALY